MNRRAVLLSLLTATFAVGCASLQTPQTVEQVIATDPNLSTFNSLVKETGALAGLGPFTVFAPSNDAFKALPAKTMAELTSNKEMAKAVVTYHVLPVKAMAADAKPGSVKTVNGANLAVARAANFVTVDEAVVTAADKAAENGVVHVVDRVLIPPKR